MLEAERQIKDERQSGAVLDAFASLVSGASKLADANGE